MGFNSLYDILIASLSIADIITNIIVLHSFYQQEKSVFFIISLCIFLISHIAYSITFIWRFDVKNMERGRYGLWAVIVAFVLTLPLGPIISLIIMFAHNYDSSFTEYFRKITHLDTEYSIAYYYSRPGDNDKDDWRITKLSKHQGFMVQAAFETIPYSILQLVFIVYYEKTSNIYITSILFSLFSVMAKSLMLSKGMNVKTYVWIWLCIITDIFGVYFISSWIFYPNEAYSERVLWNVPYLEHISFIGQIWGLKIFIGILPVLVVIILTWITFLLWKFLDENVWSNGYNNKCISISLSIVLIPLTSIGMVIFVCLSLLALETICFSGFAYIVWRWCIGRWNYIESKVVDHRVNGMADFVLNAKDKQDRILRILAANYVTTNLIASNDRHNWYGKSLKLNKKIDQVYAKDGLQGLRYLHYILSDAFDLCLNNFSWVMNYT